jgi:Leucine-rich repeat (LRR) protein
MPAAAGHLPKLKLLDLSSNQLARIPPCIPASLEALYIGANRVCELPSWLPAHAPKLVHLDAHMNNVVWIHPAIVNMPALQMLAVAQNPVLRGGGQLSTALAAGAALADVRQVLQRMTAAHWRQELDSLRGLDAADEC